MKPNVAWSSFLSQIAPCSAPFETLVHPDDRAQLLALNDWAWKTGLATRGEWCAVWPDGSVHWIAGHWQAFMDEYGKPFRIIGVNADITERKLAEQALAGMTRKLIEAQEQERTRIARELHDDVTQRLALLAIKLHQLHENPVEIQSRAQELNKEIAAISTDVQSLSHDLHSSHLEYLGVVAAMKGWCREFGERYGMQVDYRHDVQGILPREIGLCLFRVLQEALNNTAKHSGANRIEMRLQTETDEIHLIIGDRGKGFEVEPALQGKGLGLTSMRERVRLVNGTFSIQSKPMSGTTIHVRVPLLRAHETQRKAMSAEKGTVVALRYYCLQELLFVVGNNPCSRPIFNNLEIPPGFGVFNPLARWLPRPRRSRSGARSAELYAISVLQCRAWQI